MNVNKVQRDQSKIEMGTPVEAKGWARQLGVSTAMLEKTIDKVGNSAACVRKELSRLKPPD
jgi:hypothetical protein